MNDFVCFSAPVKALKIDRIFPGPDSSPSNLPDKVLFPPDLIFEEGDEGADLENLVSIAAAGAGETQILHRFPHLGQGPFIVAGMVKLEAIQGQLVDEVSRPVIMVLSAAG